MTARVNPINITRDGVVRVELTDHQTWQLLTKLAGMVGSSTYMQDLCERATNPDLYEWDRDLAREELLDEIGTLHLHLNRGRAVEIAHDLQQVLRSDAASRYAALPGGAA